jgi:hypothetical protein
MRWGWDKMNRTKSTLALSVVPPLAGAVVAGLWTPRGPLTTIQGLVTVALSLLVGLAAGYLARSR